MRALDRTKSKEIDPINNNKSSSDLRSSITRQSSMDGRGSRAKAGTSKPVNTFDWLGLGVESEANDKLDRDVLQSSITKNQEQLKPPPQQQLPILQQKEEHKQQAIVSPPQEVTTTSNSANLPMPKIKPLEQTASSDNLVNHPNNLEHGLQYNETIIHSLHQQANQLQTTISMKQQESVLMDMHRKQQSLIEQQEKQFADLIQRQSSRQQQLETQIQQQQQQIHSYINALMQQPTMFVTPSAQLSSGNGHSETEAMDPSRMRQVELETDVKRLELEKLRLEDTLDNIRNTHDQEMELVKGSHKKQMDLYEESLVQLEQRLQHGLKYSEEYHSNRYNVLKRDMDEQKQLYEQRIEKLCNEYEAKQETMRSNYSLSLEAMKSDQLAAIETIRHTKLIEFATVQDGSSYLHSLKSASNNLTEATENLQSMRINIEANIEQLHAEKEAQLNAREQQLNDKQKTIDKLVEKTESERSQLIELVRTLELKLASAEQSSNEHQWMFRQKSAALDAERTSFEREKTFVRDKHEAEEKRIKELHDQQYAEYKRLMDLVDAERESVWSEKSKLKTMARLEQTTNSTTQRQIELDSAIQIAQDASKSADTEREKLVELQRKFESKRRELIDKEKVLYSKELELDVRLVEANDQKKSSTRAIDTCKTLEQKLLLKMKSLQSHHVDLAERENKLSEAKVQLSANRMELQRLKHSLQQSKCSLCRIGVQNQAIDEHGSVLEDTLASDLKRRLPMVSIDIEKDPLDILLDYDGIPHMSTKFSLPTRLNTNNLPDPDALLLNLNLHAFDNIE